MISIQREHLTFSSIKKPPPHIRELWDKYTPPFAIPKVSPWVSGHQILSREAALSLAELHPLIVTAKHECLCNQRLLIFLTSRLNPDDRIPVGIVPRGTNPELIEQLVITDILTSTLLFSPSMPTKDIFHLSEKLPPELLDEISPALNQNFTTRAALLSTRTGTLYKWIKAERPD
ncbi:hypothetical protein SAMN02745165_03099 [Malonomonas rubra DSM 5091]|uniref:Uncharacterized protein n=1 Tax=Malonomonas rubra DSM 5091 TaxID=1122189 RepID=A0A1M6LXT3_MALRU|nr:hypothetical protein [Malonomonas rubra]SHJ75996.1 hypothetical protein SAMN02745165_03099 [Malonomonas rubra DSM 5091]